MRGIVHLDVQRLDLGRSDAPSNRGRSQIGSDVIVMDGLKKNLRIRRIVALCLIGVIVVAFALRLPVGMPAAFGWEAISLLCPIGALSAMVAGKLLIPQAVVSLAIFVLAVTIFGRAFCSWLCIVPHVSRLRKPKGSDVEDPTFAQEALSDARHNQKTIFDSRHIILVALLLVTALVGFPVFCLVCPVGLSFALIFLIIRLFAFGEATWAILVVAGSLTLELLVFRKWCNWICPISGLMSLIGRANKTFVPTVDPHKCVETSGGNVCSACDKHCPEKLDIATVRTDAWERADCTKCRICADICPSKAIALPFLQKNLQKQIDKES